MQRLTATLVAEGSSDRTLTPFIEYLLDEYCEIPHVTTFATDLPSGALVNRIAEAIRLFPCDMLFVHRDADRAAAADREREIFEAAATVAKLKPIAIIPIRMTEAWLLTDLQAIRRAAGNPSGTVKVALPALAKLEALPDPKSVLFDALKQASELGPQRLRRFDLFQARRQVSSFMADFGPLRQVPSFAHLETQVRDFFAPSDA